MTSPPQQTPGVDLSSYVADQVSSLLGSLGNLDDVEAVHQTRVRARRLRSILGAMGGALPPGGQDQLRRDLRRLGRAIGPLRDLDVLTLLVEQRWPTGAASAVWIDRLTRERAEERDRANSRLRAPWVDRLTSTVSTLGEPASWVSVPEPDPRTVRSFERARVLHRADRVAGMDLLHPERNSSLHDVRKAAKRMRYACEALVGIDPPCLEWAGAAEQVQGVLGAGLDEANLAAWLDAFAAEQVDVELGAQSREAAREVEAESGHHQAAYAMAIGSLAAFD